MARRRARVPRAGAWLSLAAALALGACQGSPPAIPGPSAGEATMPPLLAGLEATTVDIGSRILRVLVADTPEARSRGLAGTDDLGPFDGLLFAYVTPVEQSFYMRGVRVPLDIAFVGADRRVLGVLTMPLCAADPCPTYAPPGPFLWALETPAEGLGGVAVGDLVEVAVD